MSSEWYFNLSPTTIDEIKKIIKDSKSSNNKLVQKLMEKLNKNQKDVQNFLQHYFSEENVTLNKIFLTGRTKISKCLYETTLSQNKKNKI